MFKPRRHKLGIEPLFDSNYYNPHTRNIIIPESAKERSDQGIVKYLGADVDEDIKIGDHVIFSGYTGNTIAIDGELLIEIHQDFIKGTILSNDVVVPGLFFKQKMYSKDLERRVTSELAWFTKDSVLTEKATDNIMLFVAMYIDELMIPAPYEESAKMLALAHKEVADRVHIKGDYHKEQRDPIDERNK